MLGWSLQPQHGGGFGPILQHAARKRTAKARKEERCMLGGHCSPAWRRLEAGALQHRYEQAGLEVEEQVRRGARYEAW